MFKKIVIFYGALIAVILAASANAQSSFKESITTLRRDSAQAFGRDFWFAPPQNYLDQPGKYIVVSITSPRKTFAYIQIDSQITKLQVIPNKVDTFSVPLVDELKSSGIAENKAIHVWSNDADLSVYLMSHNPYTSDGTYCIPSMGFGTDYVVAAYEALFEGFGSYVFDFPSEFTITADADNTVVEITPSVDLRQSVLYPSSATNVAYPKGQTFFDTLSRGQAIQFQSVEATDADNYDVTGTIIHSNKPVGVIGASVCTNIPEDFPYCDLVLEMIPPTRTWGKTYYTTYPTQPNGTTGHDFSMHCFISSVPNQTIYRSGCSDGMHTEAILGPAFDHYYAEEGGPYKWFSDNPFLLAQYVNGSTYPDGVNGNGDPAEATVEPRENYSKTLLFQTANGYGDQAPYDNYANIIVNVHDSNVTLDGRSIHRYASSCLDDTFEIYLAPNLTPGAHLIKSDSGVGVSVYGYGYDETYSWSGSQGAWTNGSSDTISPSIFLAIGKLCIHAAISDSGSGLAEIILDSETNMTFAVDTTFIPGSADKMSFADFCVTDSTLIGYLQFTVYDLAGNHSVCTILFSPSPASARQGFTAQSILEFDTVLVGTSKTLGVFTVTDTSQTLPITIDSLWTDNSAFTMNPLDTANILPITLNPEGSHTFFVTFSPLADTSYSANVFALSTGLVPRSAQITGIGYSINAGVIEWQTKVYATIGPNPAANSVTLNYSLTQTANVTFELNSMDGKTVFQWNSDEQSVGRHIEMLDISSIAQGDYIYSFVGNGEVISGKFAVVR